MDRVSPEGQQLPVHCAQKERIIDRRGQCLAPRNRLSIHAGLIENDWLQLRPMRIFIIFLRTGLKVEAESRSKGGLCACSVGGITIGAWHRGVDACAVDVRTSTIINRSASQSEVGF